MEEFLFHPVLWVIITILGIGLIIATIVINLKRSREVKELDKMFPEGSLSEESFKKIPVEKVRRTTLERERRKKEREQKIPKRIRPKEGTKVFEDEDQEFILRPHNQAMHDQRLKPKTKITNDQANEAYSMNEFNQAEGSALKRARSMDSSQTTKETDPKPGPKTSRRLYKKSVLQSEVNQGHQNQQAYHNMTKRMESSEQSAQPFTRSKQTYSSQGFQQSSYSSSATTYSKKNQGTSESANENKSQSGFPSRVKKYSTKKRPF